MASLTERMIRAAKLDVNLYEEVEADTGAIGQAMTVVVLSSAAAGVGAARLGLGALAVNVLLALVGWFVWALLTWFIGTRLLPTERTEADVGQLLRTTGFSASPGVLRAFGFVPVLGPVLGFVTSLWMLVAMIIAVRQALDYESTGRAVVVCGIGWIVQILLIVVPTVLIFGAAGPRNV